MSEARRQVDVEQDAEDAEEDARQALVDRALRPGLGSTRDSWNRVKRENRVALAEDTDDDEED